VRIGWDFTQVPATRDGTFFHLLRWLQAVSAHPGAHRHKLYATEAFLAAAGAPFPHFEVEVSGPGGGRGLQLARERFFRAHGKRIRSENDILLALWNPAFSCDSPVLACVLDALPFLRPGALGSVKQWVQSKLRLVGAHRAKAILCTTAFTARALTEECGFDSARVFVAGIPLPPAPAVPPPLAALPEGLRAPFAFYCAARSERKNHARLVRAWRKAFPSNECRLVLAGRVVGRLSRDTEAALAEGIRAGAVRDVGEVDDATRDALYAGCDFAVYPSLYEGFGMPVLEALAAEKPVLVHRGSACEEVGGAAVLSCDGTDEESMAAALKALAGNGSLRARLAREREAVLERFSPRAVAEQILRAAEAAAELP